MEMMIRLALIVIGVMIILGILWNGLYKRKKRLSQCAPLPSETDIEKNYKIFHEDILGLHVKIADEKTAGNRWEKPISSEKKGPSLTEKPAILAVATKSKHESLCSCPDEQKPTRPEPLLYSSRIDFRVGADGPESFGISANRQGTSARSVSVIQEDASFELNKAEKQNAKGIEPIQSLQKPSASSFSAQTPRSKKNQFIAIRVVASPASCFAGYDLLETFLAHQLRYGDKKLFHRYATENDSSKKLFSLASLDEPGDFDLSEMGDYESSGLILYMDASEQEDAAFAFEEMLKTAQQLAAGLKGHLMASASQPWTIKITEKIRDELGL